MSVISTDPETIKVTDLEFIFLGGTKLSHTLGPDDKLVENESTYHLIWVSVNESATIFKTNILQLGRRERTVVMNGEETAVQKAVREIKAQEAARQGVTVKAPTPQG